MENGEIWVSDLPPTGGHVQRGYRPALIIADTTKAIAMVIPTKDNGLDKPSVLLVYQLGGYSAESFLTFRADINLVYQSR